MPSIRELIFGKRDVQPSPVNMIGFPTDGGLTAGGVTTETAIGLSAVWRCLDILANGVSQLEWFERRGNLQLPVSRIVARPQAQRTRREWTSLVVSTLALYDVCYALKVGGVDSEGVPIGLWYMDPRIVSPATTNLFSTLYLLPPDEFFVAQQIVQRDQLVIMHRSPQPTISDTTGGIIQLARATFAAAIAAERYASRYWQAGGSPTTVLETEQRLTPTQTTETSELWAEKRARGPDYAPVLSGGLKARSFGADPTSESAVEARKELVADIGRYFGVPTRILNAPTGDSQTYHTSEASNQDLVRYTLQNYIEAIQDAISEELPGGRRMVMDVAPLTRGVQLNRAQAWQLALGPNQPWMTVDEVREVEGLPPVENPSDLIVSTPTAPPPPAPDTSARDAVAVMRDEVRDLRTFIAERPEPPAPVYNISNPVTIEKGAVQVDAPPPANVEVNMPEIPATVVTIEEGAVQVAAPPPAEVTVNLPEPRKTTKSVKRDAKGRITEVVEE